MAKQWDWLTQAQYSWRFFARVLVKAGLLFIAVNFVFALFTPMEALGRLSLYNVLLPGRERLPYGENPAQSYNISLFNIPAMFAAHEISQPKAEDEYRVLFIGDSATWGWYLENNETLTGHINAGQHKTPDGRRVVAYNLGYPIMSLTKDLMILDYAMRYNPDKVVWLVTLESFPRERQLFPPIVQNNPTRVRQLINEFDLDLDPDDSRFVDSDTLMDDTIIGQRRALADLLRLQIYGFSWAATEIDQYIPDAFDLRASDFEEDLSWQSYTNPQPLTEVELAFDVLRAGVERVGDVPIVVINEPMFISEGENSDLRYNFFYPRWAYDAYRTLLGDVAEEENWGYLDLWDVLPPDEFTDSPVHTTAAGAEALAELLLPSVRND